MGVILLYSPAVETPSDAPEAPPLNEQVEVIPIHIPEEIPLSVPEEIKYYCELYGADYLLALNIGYCESQFIENAQSPVSSAKGVFQFIDSTWDTYCEGDVLNSTDNIECAVRLQAEGGLGHWSESFDCWKLLPLKY